MILDSPPRLAWPTLARLASATRLILVGASTRFFERLGPGASNALSPAPGEDSSHFDEAGARAIAALVEAELAQVAPLPK